MDIYIYIYISAEALSLRACRGPVLKFINPFLPSPWEGNLSPSLPFPMAPARSVAGWWEALVPYFSDFLPLFLQPRICIKFQTLQKLVFWTILAIFYVIFANFK